MNNDNFWFRILFKVKLYEVSGDSFQRLFQDIASYRFENFQSVAPYGNQGDGGNDGWIQDEKRYFQVYGKKADSRDNTAYAVKKAQEDFKKLTALWGNVEKYHFVYNDRFEGTPAPVIQALLNLQKAHGLSESTVLDGRKLEKIFMELTRDQKESILNSIPSEIPDSIDSRAVSEILKHLADNVSSSFGLLQQTAPDFDEKIRLNNLTSPIPDVLRNYSYQTQDVEQFLDKIVHLKQAISEEIKALYSESRNKIPDGEEDAPNIRYVWMVEELIPPAIKNAAHPHSLKAYREASQVVLAKYFEACDIYEHPDTITTS
ncbi:MAG: hypothetical protein PHC99_09685 [Methylococcales bacterium]|nr:hypothetical protein [Methylococcales bacterium]